MTIVISRGNSDAVLEQFVEMLKKYEEDNPSAEIDLYRQNSVSIRIRIIDPSFASLDKSERHAKVWSYLEQLPDELQSDVSMLLLLRPEETHSSFANLEFEDPAPSRI